MTLHRGEDGSRPSTSPAKHLERPRELRDFFDEERPEGTLFSVCLDGINAPLEGLRWAVHRHGSKYMKDDGVAHADVTGLLLELDVGAARRYDGGRPFLVMHDARVDLEACTLKFEHTSNISWLYNVAAASATDVLTDYVATTIDNFLKNEAGLLLKNLNDFLNAHHLWPMLLSVAKLKVDDLPIRGDASPRSPRTPTSPPNSPRTPGSARTPRRRFLPQRTSAFKAPAFKEVQETWL